jgi:hypothetical protein
MDVLVLEQTKVACPQLLHQDWYFSASVGPVKILTLAQSENRSWKLAYLTVLMEQRMTGCVTTWIRRLKGSLTRIVGMHSRSETTARWKLILWQIHNMYVHLKTTLTGVNQTMMHNRSANLVKRQKLFLHQVTLCQPTLCQILFWTTTEPGPEWEFPSHHAKGPRGRFNIFKNLLTLQ